MSLNPLRAILRLTADAAEALLFLLDFSRPADDLWYWPTQLADAEAEIEVWESSAAASPAQERAAAEPGAGSADFPTPSVEPAPLRP